MTTKKLDYPMCYMTGDWDGKMSDLCLCKDVKGLYSVARCYEYEDGLTEWYDADDFGLRYEVVEWMEISKIETLQNRIQNAINQLDEWANNMHLKIHDHLDSDNARNGDAMTLLGLAHIYETLKDKLES